MKPTPEIGVGQPAYFKLNAFASWVEKAFGDAFGVYLVGSAARTKKWRDVDVRLILPDDEYTAFFGKPNQPIQTTPRYSLLCAAISALGREMTGLPIDFQIDQQTEVNRRTEGQVRVALGIWKMLGNHDPEQLAPGISFTEGPSRTLQNSTKGGDNMVNITVRRYEDVPEWQGYIEPEDLGWIMFVHADGAPVVYLNRDPKSGAVIAKDAYLPYPWLDPDATDVAGSPPEA